MCLIRVEAKLCRTVALQDRSFPASHHDSNLRLDQMQYINVFQVFFPFHLMISWHFLTDLWFWIDLWTLSYDMWMDNFLRNSVPLLRNVAMRQWKNILGWGGEGWSKKNFINKMFPNKPKNDVEYFFIMHHQNACSRGLTFLISA